MPFNIGTTAAKKVYWGTTEIKKIFDGTTQKWTSRESFLYIFNQSSYKKYGEDLTIKDTASGSNSYKLARQDETTLYISNDSPSSPGIQKVDKQTFDLGISISGVTIIAVDNLYVYAVKMQDLDGGTIRIYKLNKSDFTTVTTNYFYGAALGTYEDPKYWSQGAICGEYLILGIVGTNKIYRISTSTLAIVSQISLAVSDIFIDPYDSSYFYVQRSDYPRALEKRNSTLGLVASIAHSGITTSFLGFTESYIFGGWSNGAERLTKSLVLSASNSSIHSQPKVVASKNRIYINKYINMFTSYTCAYDFNFVEKKCLTTESSFLPMGGICIIGD